LRFQVLHQRAECQLQCLQRSDDAIQIAVRYLQAAGLSQASPVFHGFLPAFKSTPNTPVFRFSRLSPNPNSAAADDRSLSPLALPGLFSASFSATSAAPR